MKRFYKAEHAGITWTRSTARVYTHMVVAKFDGIAQNKKADAELVAYAPAALKADTREYQYETMLAAKKMGDSYINHNGYPSVLDAGLYSEHILEAAKALVAKHPTLESYLAERTADRKAQREADRAANIAKDGKWVEQGFAGRPDLADALVSKTRNSEWSCYSEVVAVPVVEVTDPAEKRAAKAAEKAAA